MKTKYLQNSMVVGVIAPTLMGRIDLEKYYSAVEEAENVVIMPHGGMERRGGLKNLTSVSTGSRLFSFEFSVTQNYVMVMSTANLKVYLTNSGTALTTVAWSTALTTTQLKEMDIIQSADTVIIVHEDFNPIQIQRQGSDTSWLISNITLVNIPKFDFDPTKAPKYFNYGTSATITVQINEIVYNNDGNAINGTDKFLYKAKTLRSAIDLTTEDYTNATNWESLGVRPDVWGTTSGALTDRGYPRTCTFHQGRLWFGGSKSKPTSVWGSVVNDFFNFDTGQDNVLADDAIFDVLDTDQFNAIVNIVSGKNLQVLTAGGEFANTAEILTPSTSAWVKYTGYGAKRIKPAILDGSTYFMDRFGKTVRALIYTFEDSAYTSPPISILAEHIVNNVQDMAIVRGTSLTISNLLYLVNGDGTVAVFNTMRKENIAGWTKWTTQGNFKKVTVTSGTVTFIVERGGTEYLEVLDTSLLLDHSFTTTSNNKVEVDAFLFGEDIKIVGDSVTQSGTSAVFETPKYYAYADATKAVLYAGLNYTVKIKTLPVAIATRDQGNIVNLPKRISRCTLNLYNSRGVYVNGLLITNRKFGDATDTVFAPITGIENVYLLGYNTKAQIEITQNNPDPMTILQIDLEVTY